MRTLALVPAIAAGMAVPVASAETLTLDRPGPVQRASVAYRCDDGVARRAEFINLRDQSFAVVETGGGRRLFVEVVSGSGARYASGVAVWWTKGPEATLRDETRDGAVLATCIEETAPP